MTKREIMERLEKIADRIWNINIKDRWMYRDRIELDELHREERLLQLELRKIEREE